jgi:Tol biopolymer transport system component
MHAVRSGQRRRQGRNGSPRSHRKGPGMRHRKSRPRASRKEAPAAAWAWLGKQASPLQALLAIIGALIAVIAIVVPLAVAGSHPPPRKHTVTLRRSSLSLVSSDDRGTAADGDSGRPQLSSTGRYVAFTSDARNLAPARFPPGYGYHNIYVKDRVTGAIQWVSVGQGDRPPNGESQFPAICPSGRLIAFASQATDLAVIGPRLTGVRWRVYVHDNVSGFTYLVSVSMNGTDSNGLSVNPQFSADCSRLVFESSSSDLVAGDTNQATDVFERVLFQPKTILVSRAGNHPANSASFEPVINGSGTIVAFTSYATNLPGAVPGQPSVYLASLTNGKVTSVSAPFRSMESSSQGFGWPSFSPDGRYLVFRSVTDESTMRGGPAVLVWDIREQRSAIPGVDGQAAGWRDGCTTGVNNGTDFSPSIADPGFGHSYLVMFTVLKAGACQLILRDFSGANIPVTLRDSNREILEPSLDSSGDVIAWDVAGRPQLLYACRLRACART